MLPQEPNSKMEELLRAYAKKRREQGEPALQMHPATRKLLQDEVKRSLGSAAPPSRQSWQSLRWPLLALGGGFAALLVMFAVINMQMRQLLPATAPMNRNLSQANPVSKASAAVAEGSASPASGVSLAKEKPAEFKGQAASPPIVAGAAVAATPTTPAPGSETVLRDAAATAQPSSVGSLDEARFGASQAAPLAENSKTASPAPAVEAPRRSLAEVPPPLTSAALGATASVPIAAAALPPAGASRVPAGPPGAIVANDIAPATALASAASDGLGVAAGEFVRIHDRAQEEAAQSPLSNVLSAFRLRRSGQNVRVVDADGSVYDGQVLSGIAGGARLGGRGGARSYGRASRGKDADADANWSFKVTGTNAHLRQFIVFTGHVQGMPAATPPGNVDAWKKSAPQVQTAPASVAVPSAPNPRITGKVQVGGGKEYEIQAKPPAP
jgi:hypothetical protein